MLQARRLRVRFHTGLLLLQLSLFFLRAREADNLSRLYRKCGSLDVSPTHGPPRPVRTFLQCLGPADRQSELPNQLHANVQERTEEPEGSLQFSQQPSTGPLLDEMNAVQTVTLQSIQSSRNTASPFTSRSTQLLPPCVHTHVYKPGATAYRQTGLGSALRA
jgi:hypothetical protein